MLGKNIVLVTDNNLSTLGGEQESIKLILNGILDKESVSIVQPGAIPFKPEIIDNFLFSSEMKAKDLVRNPRALFSYCLYIIKFFRENNPEVIHTQSQFVLFSISFLLKLKLVKKSFKFIHTDRGLCSKYNYFFRLIFLSSFKSIDTLVCTTNYNKKLWQNERIKDLPVEVIFNAVDLSSFYPSRKISAISNEVVVGFAGRYADWKNWGLCQDIVYCLENSPSIRVHIAISGHNKKDLVEIRKLERKLVESLGQRLTFKVNLSYSEMADFYRELDFFVVTSLPGTESFGRTVIEAMACGNIVLSTPCGGPEEIINRSELILNDASDFADKIMELAQDKFRFNSISNENISSVADAYNSVNNVSNHVRLYS